MTSEFNKWWDDDRLTQTNPYPDDSPAFWAWEGWQAGVKAEREACAKVCDERAMRCEYEAQHELDFGGTEADVAGLRSTAWLLHVSAAEIRARSTA